MRFSANLMGRLPRREGLHAIRRAGLVTLALAGMLVGATANAQVPFHLPVA